MSDTPTPTASSQRGARKERQGLVTSDTQDKTAIVTIRRRTTHPLYAKTITRNKKYIVHDEDNQAGVGDLVRIVETRPLSKTKRWRLLRVVEKAK